MNYIIALQRKDSYTIRVLLRANVPTSYQIFQASRVTIPLKPTDSSGIPFSIDDISTQVNNGTVMEKEVEMVAPPNATLNQLATQAVSMQQQFQTYANQSTTYSVPTVGTWDGTSWTQGGGTL